MVKLTINNREIEVEEGTTILKAAQSAGFKIPTLCYCDDLKPWASCGICVVKNVDPRTGRARMTRACCTAVTPGMNIVTNDQDLYKARRTVLELILSSHPDNCLKCARNQNCELQALAAQFGIRDNPFDKIYRDLPLDESYPEIVLNRKKCISCGRCVTACQEMQGVYAMEYVNRGDKTVIGPVAGVDLAHSPCIKCGQCAVHCPVGAITIRNPIRKVFDKLADKNLTSVASIAPAVRAAIGEEFGMEPGTLTTGKLYAALRAIGFKYVFDTNFAADLTIMEEGNELLERIKSGKPLPMFTSCCPGWVDYCEKKYPDLIPHLSSCKSPQEMQGAMIKTYFAQKNNLKPEEIYNVSIMPCTAKLYESTRDGSKNYDQVLTTRELAMLLKEAGIDFANIAEDKADSIMGTYSGAGTIFGVTGGVMEAAVRTAYFLTEKKELGPIEYKDVRGLAGTKLAEVTLGGKTLRIMVIHQIGKVDGVLETVRRELAAGKEPSYHFIEVMACRGGCIGGGGQPYGVTDEIRQARTKALYTDDEKSTIRQSHNNPEIKKIYDDFLGKPLGEKSHELLHTKYEAKDEYSND